jgi:hypothetical protein
MSQPEGLSRAAGFVRISAVTAVAIVITVLGRSSLQWDKMFPDFVCYWAAGKIVASGQDLYDFELQAHVQRAYGWDKTTTGLGIYDSLPYYYPPWMGFACVALVPMGFQAAKLFWFFLNIELVLLSGCWLRDCIRGLPATIPVATVFFFAFTVACILLAQTAIIILFLILAVWKLLERRWDRWAGAVLVLLTHKPQLSLAIIGGILLWSLRQRRWGVLQGLVVSSVLLSVAACLIMPTWPVEMLNAIRNTPPPTEHYPWIGNSWYLVLKTIGLDGWTLRALYLPVALFFSSVVLRVAWNRTFSLGDLLAVGILAAFFVAPYARHYDFPILLIPFLLAFRRLPPLVGTILLTGLIVLPYVQFVLLAYHKAVNDPAAKFLFETTFFWVPVVIAGTWFAATKGGPLSAKAHSA